MKDNEISLKEYVDLKFFDYDKAISAALETLNKRLDGMNEFRATLADEQGKFLTKQEYQSGHQSISDKIDVLNKTNWPVIFSVIGIVGAFWAAGIAPLNNSITRLDSQNTQMEAEIKDLAENGSIVLQQRIQRLEAIVFK